MMIEKDLIVIGVGMAGNTDWTKLMEEESQ